MVVGHVVGHPWLLLLFVIQQPLLLFQLRVGIWMNPFHLYWDNVYGRLPACFRVLYSIYTIVTYTYKVLKLGFELGKLSFLWVASSMSRIPLELALG